MQDNYMHSLKLSAYVFGERRELTHIRINLCCMLWNVCTWSSSVAQAAWPSSLHLCTATSAQHNSGLKHQKASQSYASNCNSALVQAPYNADFNCLQLHHLSYQSMANIHNSYFSHPYVYLLNFLVLAIPLLMAKGVVLVVGFAEIMRTLLLIALK